MPDTPGYQTQVMLTSLAKENGVTEDTKFTLEVINPYRQPLRFSDCFEVVLSHGNGAYVRFFFEAMPMISLSLLVCFFGIFLFPIANFILCKVNYKYLAFGVVCFFWGLLIIGKSTAWYLNLWITDPTVCMAVDILLSDFFFITVLCYLISNLTGKGMRLIADITASIYLLAVVATILLHFTVRKDLFTFFTVVNFRAMTAIIIMMVLAVNSLFLPGADEGIRYLLVPDFERMANAGMWNVISAAMNQAFFTLSIGIGSMAIFGSYIGREQSLLGESVNVVLLDTMVAISSGLIIIPACFAYGVEPGAGPSLIFITLPNIFNNMPLGRIWGSLFFVFMTFAAFSTVLAVFENIMAMCMDQFGWSRTRAGAVNIFLLFVLSLPCALGFNVLSMIRPLGEGSSFLDLEDYIVSNFMLPLGSLAIVLFCTRRSGWGWENFKKEANQGSGLKVKDWMRPYVTWILPIMIILVFIMGLI